MWLSPDDPQYLQTTGWEKIGKMRDQLLSATKTQDYGPTDVVGEPAWRGYKHYHQGVDFVLQSPNGLATAAPVRAPATGIVEFAGNTHGYGANTVIIRSKNGWSYLIGHMSSRYTATRRGQDYDADEGSHILQTGDIVHAGDVVGFQGSLGWSTGPHVHLGLYDPSGVPQDPGHNMGNVLGSLMHALGLGAGYIPGHLQATPAYNVQIGDIPVPEPLLTGTNYNPTDPGSKYAGSPLPPGWLPPDATHPTAYDPVTGATGTQLDSSAGAAGAGQLGLGVPGLDPASWGGALTQAAPAIGLGIVGVMLIGFGLFRMTGGTKGKPTQFLIGSVKDLAKAGEVAALA